MTDLDLGTHVQMVEGWLAIRYGKPVDRSIMSDCLGDDQMLKIWDSPVGSVPCMGLSPNGYMDEDVCLFLLLTC